MSRSKLEAFLIERKLATSDGKGGFFHSGLLNRIYFYLDEIMFEGTSKGIPIRFGTSGEEVKLDNLSLIIKQHDRYTFNYSTSESIFDPSSNSEYPSRFTQGTGEGTDEGDPVIRFRNAFTHEQIFDQTSQQTTTRIAYTFKKITQSMEEWLGLVPVHHSPSHSVGVFLGLRRTATGFELPGSHEMVSPNLNPFSVHQVSEETYQKVHRQIDTTFYDYSQSIPG